MHGNIFEACSLDQKYPYTLNDDIKIGDLHPKNNKQLRHNTILFGEQLLVNCYNLFKYQVKKADYLIIIGSSLSVGPSNLITNYNKNIIYINPLLPEDIHYNHWNIIQDTACNGIRDLDKFLK